MSTRSAVKTGLRSVLEMELRKCLWLVDLGPGFSWTFIPSFSDPFTKENLPLMLIFKAVAKLWLLKFSLLFGFLVHAITEVRNLGVILSPPAPSPPPLLGVTNHVLSPSY